MVGDVLADGIDPRKPVSEVARNAVKKAGAKEGDLGQQAYVCDGVRVAHSVTHRPGFVQEFLQFF